MAFVTWKMRKLVQIYSRAVKWYEASIHAYVAFRLSSSSPSPPPQKRFHVAMRLVSNGSQKKSKRGENISDTLACGSCATSLFSPQLDVICDLIKNRRTATWNLFVTREENVKINNLKINEGNQNYYYVYFHNEFCVIHS